MEIVVSIILLLVGLSFILKLSFHKPTGLILLCIVAAAFIILCCDYAVGQSKTVIADWLTQSSLMLDTSVILTIDVVFQICFCILMAESITGELTRRKKIWLGLCLWVPGLLIFPVLFALLVEIIFALPGADFTQTAWLTAAAVAVFTPLLVIGVRFLLPESDLRLELMFIVSLITAALGVVATVNGRTAVIATDSTDPTALVAIIALVAVMAIAGYQLNKFITAKKISKIK